MSAKRLTSMAKWFYVALAALVLPAAFNSSATADSAAPPPLQQAYENVLSALRRPPADGVMLVSVELPTEITECGLRPGDVIMRADGKSISTQADLAAQFAKNDALNLLIARGQTNLTLRVPNSVLSLEMISVTAGMPAPLNPPATPRKDFDLMWNQVPTIEPQPGQAVGHDMWFLVFDSNQDACGALHLTINGGTDGSLDWDFAAPAGGPLLPQAWHIEFQTGDNHSTLPFEFSDAVWSSGPGQIILAQDGRQLYAKTNDQTAAESFETLPGAIPTPALCVLAAALPHKPGIVLPVAEITPQNLATQPGCVLATHGEDKISIGGVVRMAWKVELLRYDIPAYSFWFGSDGSLIMMDLGDGVSAIQVSGQAAVNGIFPPGSLQNAGPGNPQSNQ